jgi:hypothetical protein
MVGRMKRLGRPVQILRYLLAFCVWLGCMYLMAMINDALFAIFLGSSMIIGGIYIPPRSGRDRLSNYPPQTNSQSQRPALDHGACPLASRTM